MRATSTRKTVSFNRALTYSLVLLLILGLLLTVPRQSTALGGASQDDSRIMVLNLTENFDGVTAPALPAGWTTIGAGSNPAFVTATGSSESAPNMLSVPNPSSAGQTEIVSPSFTVHFTGGRITFRHSYNSEVNWDGGVVEISINGGAFVDIITAGGTFNTNGYNGVAKGTGNPLPVPPATSRPAWTGSSSGFLTTDINLPPAAAGQSIRLKWRFGTDSSVGVAAPAGGWRIDNISIINNISGENVGAMTIPDSGNASLYPSSITVSGMIGAVSNVVVILDGLSHTAPDDVDLLLVSPSGRSVVLMSDVGGTTAATNVVLTIRDQAANSMPDEGPLVSGDFKPTNIGAGDAFPPPAPSSPAPGAALTSLIGANPNGVWSLYLVDDNGNNAGSIASGWAIRVETSTISCSLSLSSSVQAFSINGGDGSFDVITPFGCEWSATAVSDFLSITSAPNGAGGTQVLTFHVQPNMSGPRSGRIQVTNTGVTRLFTVQQQSGCPFSLNQESQNFPSAGGAGSVQVTAAGECGWTVATTHDWLDIGTASGTGNGMVNFTVEPNNTNSPRTGTILIGARVLTITQARTITRTPFDFDGDLKADLSVYRAGAGAWHINNSSNGSPSSQLFGLSTDRIVPADYDGDNKTDIAVFRAGAWYILLSSNGAMRSDQWGLGTDRAMPADYDGDGKADLAVWRESNGAWYIRRSSDDSIRSEQFGIGGDKPVTGDYDRDGKSDLAVFRPSTNTWYVLQSSNGAIQGYLFGLSTDILAPADYDADGKTDVAVYRPSDGTWYIQQSSAGFTSRQFGLSTDVPVPADYDGDGRADIAVFRQGIWHILQSTNGTTRTEQWGVGGDTAAPSAFLSN